MANMVKVEDAPHRKLLKLRRKFSVLNDRDMSMSETIEALIHLYEKGVKANQ